MKTHALCLLVCASLVGSAWTVESAVPQLINYQGRVLVSGTNFNGAGQFKFALVNGAGTVTFWSNNGSSVGGSQPTAAVTLPVANGLVMTLLGDTTMANMTVIPITVFTNPDVRLRVWFNGGPGFQQLTPDQRIVSVGYAMMAETVPDGAITAAKIAPGVLTPASFPANSVTSAQLADDLDLGSSSVAGRLDVFRTAAGTAAISLIGSSSQISTYGSDGLEQIRLWGAGYGELLLYDQTNNTRTVRLSAGDETGRDLFGPPSGGSLLLTSKDGTNQAFIAGGSTGGTMTLYQRDGGTGIFLDGDSSGAGLISVRSTNGSTRIQLDGLSAVSGGGGELSVYDGDGTETVEILGAESTSQGGRITLRSDTGVTNVRISAEEFGGTGEGGVVELFNSDAQRTVRLDGDGLGGGGVYVQNTGGLTAAAMQTSSDGSGFFYLRNAAGSATITLDGDASGEGRITTQVLTITGGADLSEQFDVNAERGALQPGMIVCIDPKNAGELVLSSKAYDRAVAGVISGAGGVKPGMLMGQHGTKADGKHAVALTGRVYCWVDADGGGAVQPGDLITTSNTPGHGMKVTDHTRAAGAIVGKAMTALDKGEGLVLVLVSLQ